MAISWICEEREKSDDSTAAHVFRGSVYGGEQSGLKGKIERMGLR